MQTDRRRGFIVIGLAAQAACFCGCSFTDLDELQRGTGPSDAATATTGTSGSGASTSAASGGATSSSSSGGSGGAATTAASSGGGGSGGVVSMPACVPVAGQNVLLNGGMELGPMPPPGMGNWNGYRAAVTEDDVANGGAKSLLVCKDEQVDGDGDYFATYADLYPLPANIGAGWKFSASICVRAAPGFPAPTSLELVIREQPITTDHLGSSLTVIDTDWKLLTVEGMIDQSTPSVVSLIVGASSLPDGTCFLADDAAIVHPP